MIAFKGSFNITQDMALILTPDEIVDIGLTIYKGLDHHLQKNYTKKVKVFRSVYDSSPAVLASIWSDLNMYNEELQLHLTSIQKSKVGFRQLLVAMHFLWAYPKNAVILAAAFGLNECAVQGENLWMWV